MKLHDLLDVMDPQMRIEIIVTEADAYGGILKAFDGKVERIPISTLRRYGDYDVERIDRPSLDHGDNGYDVEFDGYGTLCFWFKNAIQIYL